MKRVGGGQLYLEARPSKTTYTFIYLGAYINKPKASCPTKEAPQLSDDITILFFASLINPGEEL